MPEHPAQPPPRPQVVRTTAYFRSIHKRDGLWEVFLNHRQTDQMNKVAFGLSKPLAEALRSELNDVLARYDGLHIFPDSSPKELEAAVAPIDKENADVEGHEVANHEQDQGLHKGSVVESQRG